MECADPVARRVSAKRAVLGAHERGWAEIVVEEGCGPVPLRMGRPWCLDAVRPMAAADQPRLCVPSWFRTLCGSTLLCACPSAATHQILITDNSLYFRQCLDMLCMDSRERVVTDCCESATHLIWACPALECSDRSVTRIIQRVVRLAPDLPLDCDGIGLELETGLTVRHSASGGGPKLDALLVQQF